MLHLLHALRAPDNRSRRALRTEHEHASDLHAIQLAQWQQSPMNHCLPSLRSRPSHLPRLSSYLAF